MPLNMTANPYAHSHEVMADGSVVFQCSRDLAVNPWLALAPHHPVVVQTQSYWTAVGGSIALQGMETSKWTALTWTDWELGDGVGGHAVRGVYRNATLEGEHAGQLGYSIELVNQRGAVIVTIRGKGVVFRNRNFEQWREGAKQKARKAGRPGGFVYADKAALALTNDERVLVAPFEPACGYVEALVDDTNGFPPGNPMSGGSGDHVNSTHLHELARQALFLIKRRTDIDTSGTMSLNRYVELGAPVRLHIEDQADNAITFEVAQMEKPCAQINLRW